MQNHLGFHAEMKNGPYERNWNHVTICTFQKCRGDTRGAWRDFLTGPTRKNVKDVYRDSHRGKYNASAMYSANSRATMPGPRPNVAISAMNKRNQCLHLMKRDVVAKPSKGPERPKPPISAGLCWIQRSGPVVTSSNMVMDTAETPWRSVNNDIEGWANRWYASESNVR